jgi:adenine-specific DNA methylase
MIINEIEKYTNELILSEDERELLINKVIKSNEYQKYIKLEIDSVYEANIFQLQNARSLAK